MNNPSDDQDAIRRKVIGLGEDSLSKSYYPQLQENVKKLEEQKNALEEKTKELTDTLIREKETKALLKESERKYRVLFESASDAIFIFNSQNECVEGNIKAVELLKLKSKDELIGIIPYNLPPSIQPNGETSFDLGRRKMDLGWNDEAQVFEWLFKLKDEKLVYCEVSLNRIEIRNTKFLQAIVRDITDYKKLEHDISMATIRTEERERLRFAKELHDGIGPILSTVKLYVQWLDETKNEEHIKVIKKKIAESIIEATKSLKEVSHNLSPHVLNNYGLIEAVKVFVGRIHETGKLQINLSDNFEQRLNSDLEAMFYRVVTELINNTIKHAQASEVVVEFSEKENVIVFNYLDNGKGYNLEQMKGKRHNMGLNNIRNRVKRVGGSVEFFNSKEGAQVNIVIVKNRF